MRLAVHTLFLPRESLPYMEEWLLYHTLLGFDEFKLYDNTGSSGDVSSPFRQKYGNKVTKYGLPTISEETSDERINEVVQMMCSKFNAEIIPWPTEHFSQEVLLETVKDHCHREDSDYTAFIDMDEYVCVGSHLNIKDFMREEVHNLGFCGVRMSQQKMPHILEEKATSGRRVWELTDTFQMETRGWAPKNILTTKSVFFGANIHDLNCSGKILDEPERSLIKINHYNTSEYQIYWLRQNHGKYDKKTPLESLYLGQSQDYSLHRFKKEMNEWHYVRWEDL